MQRISITLSRSAFDLETGYHSSSMTSGSKSPSLYLYRIERYREVSRRLDPSVDDAKLRTILIDIREQFIAFKLLVSDSPYAKHFSFPSVAMHCVVCYLRLLIHYVDVTKKLHGAEALAESAPCSSGYAYVQAYTILAAVYWARTVSMHDTPIDSSNSGASSMIFEAGPLSAGCDHLCHRF